MASTDEIRQGISILEINYRKQGTIEPEFYALMEKLFGKWPDGLFKSACFEVVKKEPYFPSANLLLEYGGRIRQRHDLSNNGGKVERLLLEMKDKPDKVRFTVQGLVNGLANRKKRPPRALTSEDVGEGRTLVTNANGQTYVTLKKR
jgi:hypothetical protein